MFVVMAHMSSKISPFPGCPDPRSAGDAGGVPTTGDPTKELRSFIEGLQDEARQARSRQESAEEERDRLAEEVRRLQREVDAAANLRKETRDIASERDRLFAEQERQQLILAEVRRKGEGAERLRAQLESQRDQAINLYKEFRKEAENHVAARDEAVRQRDAALRQRAQVTRDHEELAKRYAEAQRQLVEAQKALVDAQQNASSKRSDGEVQKQIASIRLARDNAAAQVAEMRGRIAELEDTVANLIYDREVSDKATKRAVVEMESFRTQAETDAQKAAMLETLQAELAEVGEELTALREQYASAQGAKEQLVAQLREFRDTHTSMLVSNTGQIESTTKERDVLRTRLQEREAELAEVRAELAAAWAGAMQVTEPEIERLSKELEGMKTRSAEVDDYATKHEEMSRQREDMRLQVIELNAQLENARREIKEIGALLAEARLQNKLASKGAAIPVALAKPVAVPPTPPAIPEPAELTPAAPTVEAVVTEPEPAPVEEKATLLEEEVAPVEKVAALLKKEAAPEIAEPAVAKPAPVVMDRLEAMRLAYHRWKESRHDHGLLWEVAKEAAAYCGSNQAAGEQILQRVSGKLAAWLEAMLESQGHGTDANLRTIGQAIEFLSALERISDVDKTIRLTGSRVYVVDDDPGVCAMISDTLGAAGFVVESTLHPSSAIAQLAAESYDLILLDVRLPEVDGFELCGYIRGLDEHQATPIMYVTGVAGSDFQSMSGSEFVGKPFHPAELTLRSMMEVIRPQLIPA
jgi:CheY-like chemotaxis protein